MKARRPAQALRRLLLALLLPTLMLLAQQGAAWHALGHLSASTSTSSAPADDDETLAQHGLCLSCLAYASVDSASAPLAWADALLEFSHAWVVTRPTPSRPADAPPAHSRGPPQVL
jgi:hypothetical protein